MTKRRKNNVLKEIYVKLNNWVARMILNIFDWVRIVLISVLVLGFNSNAVNANDRVIKNAIKGFKKAEIQTYDVNGIPIFDPLLNRDDLMNDVSSIEIIGDFKRIRAVLIKLPVSENTPEDNRNFLVNYNDIIPANSAQWLEFTSARSANKEIECYTIGTVIAQAAGPQDPNKTSGHTKSLSNLNDC